MSNRCKVRIKDDIFQAAFYGVFQVSYVIAPSMIKGGHSGGVTAQPIAVVDYGDGLTRIDINHVFDIEEEIK